MKKVIIYVGIKGSGKSTHANDFANEHEYIISDSQIENITNKLEQNDKLIIDAELLKIEERIKIINFIKEKYPSCSINCFYMAVDLDTCINRNITREDKTLESEIFNSMLEMEVPSINEGYDNMELVSFDKFKTRDIYFDNLLSYEDYLKKILNYPFLNKCIELPHDCRCHAFSVSRHMYLTYKNLSKITDDKYLKAAAMLHDVGKGMVKKIEEDEYASYTNHDNVSAQLAIPFLLSCGIAKKEIFLISFYIQNHMLVKKRTDESYLKYVGEEIDNLKLLRIADDSCM